MLPGTDKGLLRRILCQIRISTHTVHHVDNSLPVTADQFTKGSPVPLLSLGDQFWIGNIGFH